eukprot:NODE_3412_length_932_cov_5.318233_g2842_i0.p1 GENE.NODE_3412_length_932_cov_5.318233_g2842_i0~~NODE_3412_length_932_cov_5.318233_g2842_i0.p1  ORF type:complete len:309 (-),score=-28.63 NODE_3412_length_932_cov_5.318233_g2842_i0:5-847(-)
MGDDSLHGDDDARSPPPCSPPQFFVPLRPLPTELYQMLIGEKHNKKTRGPPLPDAARERGEGLRTQSEVHDELPPRKMAEKNDESGSPTLGLQTQRTRPRQMTLWLRNMLPSREPQGEAQQPRKRGTPSCAHGREASKTETPAPLNQSRGVCSPCCVSVPTASGIDHHGTHHPRLKAHLTVGLLGKNGPGSCEPPPYRPPTQRTYPDPHSPGDSSHTTPTLAKGLSAPPPLFPGCEDRSRVASDGVDGTGHTGPQPHTQSSTPGAQNEMPRAPTDPCTLR